MADPDYMAKIDPVASTNCVRHTPEERVLMAWDAYEARARQSDDDVFTSDGELRRLGRVLIAACYEAQPLATPEDDCTQLREKNAAYGGSWCARGGRGAFFTFCRKADRLREQLKLKTADTEDTIGDLRRYLILAEAWHVATPRKTLLETVKTNVKRTQQVKSAEEAAIEELDTTKHHIQQGICVYCDRTEAECVGTQCGNPVERSYVVPSEDIPQELLDMNDI